MWKIQEDISFFLNFLTEQEKQSFHHISHPNKQVEFAAVRYLARIVCENFLHLSYEGIEKNENGKPFLKEVLYEISVSHCLPYVAIALHPSQSVGVDVEREQAKLLKVAPRVFSEKELLFCNNSLQKTCIVWSCKETLYKIYAKKGLSFQTDLIVNAFDELHQTIQSKIQTAHYQKICQLYHYELEKGVHLCYGI
ncbi:MAG: hypothetical protein OHK0045_23330 [Raineya sp.]